MSHRFTFIQDTLSLVTSSRANANDATRMVKWFELVMQPIKVQNTMLMVWCENCASPKTRSVEDVTTVWLGDRTECRVPIV
jgi:hypothetical protein